MVYIIQPVKAPLYVITSIINPSRYRTRYKLYKDFEKYITDAGGILYTVEAAYHDREFEITQKDNPHHIQVRTMSELWHKENLINIGVSRLPSDWKYVAWIDADVKFARPDIVEETIHQLQHYHFVQMFSNCTDLNHDHEAVGGQKHGFIKKYIENDFKGPPHINGPYYGVWHPGYAWACRKDAWDHVGGLIDFAIVGSADRYMACGLIGRMEDTLDSRLKEHCPEYTQYCMEWQARAERYIKRNVGCVEGLIMHFFHGSKAKRNYANRNSILWENKFNPIEDIKRDSQGVWQLSNENPKLRDSLRTYFRSRNEDWIN